MKNTFFLLVGNFGLRFFTAGAAILLVRYLGAREYGLLSVAFALGAIADFLAKMSLSHTIIREGTKPDANFPRLFGGALKLRLMFSLAATVILAVFIATVYDDAQLRTIAYLVVLPSVWGGSLRSLGEVYFQVVQKMEYTALLRAVPGLVTSAVLVVGILLHWPLLGLALAYGAAALVSGLIGLWVIFKMVPGLSGWHSGLLQGLGGFALGGVLTLLIGQLGVLILERITDFVEVGHFAVAFRIPAILYTFPGALAAAFYTQLFHFGNRDLEQHLRLTLQEIKFMSLLGITVALPFALYPEWIVGVLFGAKWVGTASKVLSILIWVVVLQSINYPLADALSTRGMQNRRTAVLAIGLTVGAGLFILLGSRWGAFGGAMAAVSLECILLIGFTAMNPECWQILRRSLLPQGLLILLTLGGGILIKTFAPWEIMGFILAPLMFVGLNVFFDREIREKVCALPIIKERFYVAQGICHRTRI
jgi:O-antigen/teichoic acid export membrane protein